MEFDVFKIHGNYLKVLAEKGHYSKKSKKMHLVEKDTSKFWTREKQGETHEET